MAQLLAILVFPVLQTLPLAKTRVPQIILTQAACETPPGLAAVNFSKALPPHKLAFSPFALTIIFLHPKASPASFTEQGKWKNRVSHSQGKGLQCAPPSPQVVPPSAGCRGLGWKPRFQTPHAQCYGFADPVNSWV